MKKWNRPTLQKLTSVQLTSLIEATARSFLCEEYYYR